VGGNVSLYNESRGRDIDPTPVVGVLGVIDRLTRRPPGPALVDGASVLLLGGDDRSASLAGSAWAWARRARGGVLPDLDLDAHARLCALVRGLVGDGLVAGVHDVSDGGMGGALVEMAVAGDVGCRVTGVADHAALFTEAPSRVLVCAAPPQVAEIVARAGDAGVRVSEVGSAGGDRVVVDGLFDAAMADVRARWTRAIPLAVGGP
jgi:phosphoribosylformylglycinamidine synthase